MLASAGSIDDTDRLQAGASGAVLGFHPRAGSTAGKWLRQIGFGQMRRLDAAAGELLRRGWGAGARPKRLVIDLDSSITHVHDNKKAGARYGHTRVLGYHPPFATSAGSGDVIHARFRRGAANTQYGATRFFTESIARWVAGRSCERVSGARRLGVRELRATSGDRPPWGHLQRRRHDAGPRASGDRGDPERTVDPDSRGARGPHRIPTAPSSLGCTRSSP